jgi:hypothetical protein
MDISVREASGAQSAPSVSDAAATTSNADESSTPTELVPRASWAAVYQEKAQLEEELRGSQYISALS